MTVNEHKYVDVNFGRERTARKSGLYQYDYGQILRVSDLELPEYVTVGFSLTDTRGSTETRVGKAAERNARRATDTTGSYRRTGYVHSIDDRYIIRRK